MKVDTNDGNIYYINSNIVEDNIVAAQSAFQRQEYILCFLLLHSLIEGLLRTFLKKNVKDTFNEHVKSYITLLKSEGQVKITFEKELTEINKRRNRVVHQLWEKGYTRTNKGLKPACIAAFQMYGLFIEWLDTF